MMTSKFPSLCCSSCSSSPSATPHGLLKWPGTLCISTLHISILIQLWRKSKRRRRPITKPAPRPRLNKPDKTIGKAMAGRLILVPPKFVSPSSVCGLILVGASQHSLGLYNKARHELRAENLPIIPPPLNRNGWSVLDELLFTDWSLCVGSAGWLRSWLLAGPV